jgi:hypothetical protein
MMERLNSWWRLWIVLSIIWVTVSLAAVMPVQSVVATTDARPTSPERLQLLMAQFQDANSSRCLFDQGQVKADTPTNQETPVPMRLECVTPRGLTDATAIVLLPPFLVALMGLIIFWAANGFRRPSSAEAF